MRRYAVFLLLIAVLPVRAQDTTHVLPGVTVHATRDAAQIAATGRALVLDRTALAATAAPTLADLLARRGGVSIKPLGSTGLASPSLRGTGASQTLVLLDGFRLNDPQLGQVDLSLLPTALLDRAEVLHGGASAWHGTDALGGVIALTTRAPRGTRAEVTAEGGAYGLLGASAVAQNGDEARGVLIALAHRQQTGDFPFSLDGQSSVRRRNADAEQNSVLVRARHGRLHAGLWLTDAERGLPGPAGNAPQRERQYDRSARLWLRADRPIGRGTASAGLALQRGTLRYVNPLLALDETGTTRGLTADAEARQAISAAWLAGAGLTYGYTHAAHPALAADASEHRAGLFGWAEGQIGRLHAAPSLRLDAYAHRDGVQTALSPRLGVGIDVAPMLRLMASAARAFRVPTFNDRFWQPGGNPDLRPERGWTYDAGLRFRRGGVAAEATAFVHHVRDEIVWQPTGAVWSPANVGRVQTRGIELSAEVRWATPGRPHAGVFYTLTDARDCSDPASSAFDQPLRYVPREQARLYGGATLGPFTLDAGLRYTGRRYVRSDGRDPLAPFVVAEVQVRFAASAPGGTLRAGAVLDNAFDHRYSVVQGYPMPPRHFRFHLTYRWSR